MAKIGRNERCPCGSGRKYKHCCAHNPRGEKRPSTAEEQLRISLMKAVEKSVGEALQKKQAIAELGVFVLLSTSSGNCWLFEVTQSDCVQLASDGEALPIPIDENPKTIEIEWSHTFAVKDKKMVLTAYTDKTEKILEDCPVKEVAASVKRIRKKIPPEMLKEIHIG
ncbi:MAG: SEC-C metal-binding domain-containing protein [Desulfofustis sp.]